VPEAFFFGPGDQLFANYHLPAGGSGQVLTVICPPLFLDYTRTQLALGRLAVALAERSQHVLRFDYRGTGDSFGDFSDVTVSDWVGDIALAVREGIELSGCRKVRLLGVRAGALLASRFSASSSDVQRLVLWDPVPNGTAYLQELRRVHSTLLGRHLHLSRSERREAKREYAGYPISEHMLEEFRSLDTTAYLSVAKSKLHVIKTSSPNGFSIAGVSQDSLNVSCEWDADLEELVMPQQALVERLIACLTLS
jgi:pimeloyl-ACP methyl ester carboxylesterase